MDLLHAVDAGHLGLLFAIGLTAGFLSGIIGMGGALLLVPALAFIGGVPFKLSTGIASLHALAVGVFGYVVHGRYGTVDTRIGLVAGVTSLLGGLLGAAISGWIDAPVVKIIYLGATGLSLVLLLARTTADLFAA